MKTNINLYVYPSDVARTAISLNEVRDIEAQIFTRELAEPNPEKDHGIAYSMNFSELVLVTISVASLTTSITTLAKAILDYLKQSSENKSIIMSSEKPCIIVNNELYVIESIKNEEELVELIKKQLFSEQFTGIDFFDESQFDEYCNLHETLIQLFNLEELKNLCFKLQIDYESLVGEGKSGKARELVLFCIRHGKYQKLSDTVIQLRPNASANTK